MGQLTKQQININRLLGRCDAMASHAQHAGIKADWRLSKYLKHLDEEVNLLKDAVIQVSVLAVLRSGDVIREYRRKIDFLKELVKADQLENPLERTLICQHLLPSTVVAGGNTPTGYDTSKDLLLQVKGKHQRDLRNELFGENEKDSNALRRRRRNEEEATKDNIDDILKHHHQMQEKVAEEMIKMAQSMKQNSLIARDIIKSDNLELDRATKVADTNYKQLKVESDRLDELNKKKCSCSIWLMLAVVCILFINMIIFIKFFPKRKK